MPLNLGVEITYLGHSTVLIQTPGGKKLIVDPWTYGNPACPAKYKQPDSLGKLDLMLITHLHSDHAGDGVRILTENPDATLVGIFEAALYFSAKVSNPSQPMNKGGNIKTHGLSINMTHAFHSSSVEEEDGSLIYGGEAAGYVITMENGVALYAAGDTALFGDMVLIKELYKPDIALLPIGDRFTMGPKEAAYAATLLGVKHVVPIHYATFPMLSGSPEELISNLKAHPEVEVHVIPPGDTLR